MAERGSDWRSNVVLVSEYGRNFLLMAQLSWVWVHRCGIYDLDGFEIDNSDIVHLNLLSYINSFIQESTCLFNYILANQGWPSVVLILP